MIHCYGSRFAQGLAGFLLLCASVSAENLSEPSNNSSKHQWYLTSQSQSQQFALWQIDSGYRYRMYDHFQLYIGTRMITGDNLQQSQKGFTSGLQYQVSDRLSFTTGITAPAPSDDSPANSQTEFEFSSQYQFEHFNLNASMDVKEQDSQLSFGIGLNF
ncbi:hypothetical protein VST7929_00496 [Vibrio stylophorae]|uniref:Uncharacterized protein n=1 Tax=Vibrio stylophorae TaxID=659351 RepID=A0ABM8ZQT4_9VIBR|nr:hypothetical protein [Vibrio stylophorae]CAH0532656.1 hypothetical protein VST7929_00496 [Vibrio stylophorae]